MIDKDNEIVIQNTGTRKFEIHLGFLQLNHKYSITISIPRSHFQSYDINANPVCIENERNHLKIVSADGSSERILFRLELYAFKEQLMTQEFCFKFSDPKDIFIVILKARVLGNNILFYINLL